MHVAMPTTVPANTTLYFAPGVHHVPADSNGWRVYSLPSDVRVFIDASAVLHGAVTNAGAPGKDTILLEGYGVLSGEDQPRCSANTAAAGAAAGSAAAWGGAFTHADSRAGRAVGEHNQAGCCKLNKSPEGIKLNNVKHAIVRG